MNALAKSAASRTCTVLQAYQSPLGTMTLAAAVGAGLPDGGALTGAWFDGQAHDRAGVGADVVVVPAGSEQEPPVLAAARAWLERYFSGAEPGEVPALAARGTAFQQRVWAELRQIPRGQTRTYGQIAEALTVRSGQACSARAVGGAVGRNPLSVFVPCHRVLGANGSLTGYAGGVERKTALLRLEGRKP